MESEQKRAIVVMGGSFNPPTIAHLRLMEAAVQAVGAEKGIFVPVGEAYLKRKMRKSGDHICLDAQLRLKMLRAMCARQEQLTVSDLEIRNQTLYTRDSMHILQQQFPTAKLYFIAGADKLPLLGSLAEKSDFLVCFGVVLFSREGVDAEAVIRQDERFAPFAETFVHVRQPEGVDGISATEVRKLIAARQTEKARPSLHEAVWPMVSELTPEDFPPEIECFDGEYVFLSGLYPTPVCYDGLTFTCAEAAFQAARCLQACDRKRIAQGDGLRAKNIAARAVQRPDWDEVKQPVMEAVQRAKFAQNPALARKLAETGNAVLIFGTKGKNGYWGRNLYTNQGENQLGQLLMKLRAEIQMEMECEKE